MTTASHGVAVVATQLARTDRRALSEAWYSALHLARGATPGPRSAAPHKLAETPLQRTPRSAAGPANAAIHTPAPQTRTRAARSAALDAPPERRRQVTDTTRRIERAIAVLRERRPVPAAQTVDIAGGRVRLLVHGDGRVLHIVALCSAALREPVERALASARFTLAGNGVAVGAI